MHFGHGSFVSGSSLGFSLCSTVFAPHHHLQGERVFNVEASVEGIPLSWASCSSVLVSAGFVLMCRFFHSPDFFSRPLRVAVPLTLMMLSAPPILELILCSR